MQSSYDTDKRKFLSALCHASIFLSATVISVAVPIGVMFISDDAVVKGNAKEALNFHLNVWFYGILIGILSVVTFGLAGWVLFPIWTVLHCGLSIWAVLQCLKNPETYVHYPFIFRPL